MHASIDGYFQALQKVIAAATSITTSNIAFEKRNVYIGFVRGDLYFADGSLLHFRELIDLRRVDGRSMYAYHYQRADQSLIFRYDNTRHFFGLPFFPHHKHVGDETTVIPQRPPTLAAVIAEIETWLANQPLDQDE
ncbi:MAG: DUF6516 family protein [Chloroflexi bacterium]|nr:DUF6516 family protein [Chloroflexota bacterium]